jgi:hypothetical protein
MDEKDYDGIIMTMFADDPKWSFVGLNSEKLVTKVVEKEALEYYVKNLEVIDVIDELDDCSFSINNLQQQIKNFFLSL